MANDKVRKIISDFGKTIPKENKSGGRSQKPKVDKGSRSSMADCIDAAKAALNNFSEDDFHAYLNNVFSRASEYPNLSGQAAITQAMVDENDAVREILLSDCATLANNANKLSTLTQKIRSSLTNLKDFIYTGTVNKDYNVENAQRAAKQRLLEILKPLSGDEIKAIQNGALDDQIAQAADGKKVSDPIAQKVGDVFAQYPEIRNHEMLKSNALSIEEIRDDRMLRQIHNAGKISRAGSDQVQRATGKNKVDTNKPVQVWRETIKPLLNLEKMFKNTRAMGKNGKLDMKMVDSILDKSFDNIVHDRSALFTRSIVANDIQALAKKRRMFFVFKDWQSLTNYNKQFGEGNLFNALMKDMNSSSNKIGMAEIFGSNPDNQFKLSQKAQEEIRPQTKMQQLVAENLFQQVKGADKIAWSTTLANIGSAIRAFSGMARLSLNVIQSFSDMSQAAAAVSRFGYGYWKPMIDQLSGAFDLLPSEDRRFVAKTLMMDLKTHMGYTGRFVDATQMGDVTSKLTNTFYFLNMTQAWDKGLKLSSCTTLARGLGRAENTAWENLNPQSRSQLERFNLNKHEWDMLRTKNTNGLFTLDNLDKVSQAELRSTWNLGDKTSSLVDYRGEMQRKIFAMFDTLSTNSVLDPLAFEHMILSGNARPGTPTGELMRTFMQFKSYPISYFRRTIMNGMSEMNTTGAKLQYAVNLAAGNLVLGYLSTVLGSWAKGLTAPDPSQMTTRQQIDYYREMITGSFGVFNRVLDQKDENSHILYDLGFSPSMRLIGDAAATAFALVPNMDLKTAGKNMADLAKYANPLATTPFLGQQFDKLFGNKPYMEPGQQPLFGT